MNDALVLSGTKKSIPHYESGREDLNFRPPGSEQSSHKESTTFSPDGRSNRLLHGMNHGGGARPVRW